VGASLRPGAPGSIFGHAHDLAEAGFTFEYFNTLIDELILAEKRSASAC
jgi:hypothetical protein